MTSYDLFFEISLQDFDAGRRRCEAFTNTLTFSTPTRFTDEQLTVPDNTFFTFLDICNLQGRASGSCACNVGMRTGLQLPNPLCTGAVCSGVSCSGAQCKSWTVDTPSCARCINLLPTCQSGYSFDPITQKCVEGLPPDDADNTYFRTIPPLYARSYLL